MELFVVGRQVGSLVRQVWERVEQLTGREELATKKTSEEWTSRQTRVEVSLPESHCFIFSVLSCITL
jgi:hypothetical protein